MKYNGNVTTLVKFRFNNVSHGNIQKDSLAFRAKFNHVFDYILTSNTEIHSIDPFHIKTFEKSRNKYQEIQKLRQLSKMSMLFKSAKHHH